MDFYISVKSDNCNLGKNSLSSIEEKFSSGRHHGQFLFMSSNDQSYLINGRKVN